MSIPAAPARTFDWCMSLLLSYDPTSRRNRLTVWADQVREWTGTDPQRISNIPRVRGAFSLAQATTMEPLEARRHRLSRSRSDDAVDQVVHLLQLRIAPILSRPAPWLHAQLIHINDVSPEIYVSLFQCSR